MWTKREFIIFFAGAQTFHTLSHIFIHYLNIWPLELWSMRFTLTHNLIFIAVNALATYALIWWASELKR